jgi:hypothetical protein
MNNEENSEYDICENRVIKNRTNIIDSYYDSLPNQPRHQKPHWPNCQLTCKYHSFSLTCALQTRH